MGTEVSTILEVRDGDTWKRQGRVAALDVALAEGRISRMSYLLDRMRFAEEDADEIIKSTPEAQAARLQLQYDDQRAFRPREPRKYHA